MGMKIAPSQKAWCTKHFSYVSLLLPGCRCWGALMCYGRSLLKASLTHLLVFIFCNFALSPTTPSLWRSLDLDFAALVMSHSNIFTHPSILVRGLAKQRKDRVLLVDIPKWRAKRWKIFSALIRPELRQNSWLASINRYLLTNKT